MNKITISVILAGLTVVTFITFLIIKFRAIDYAWTDAERNTGRNKGIAGKTGIVKPYDNPKKFDEYYKSIMTRPGEASSGYKPGYRVREFSKAQINRRLSSSRVAAYQWTERGP